MAYSGLFVFGDSLVDAGNALKLAQWYGTLTFSDLPDGAPTASLGYYQGRFTNGYTFADLLANKTIGTVTKPVFPYGYEDPWLDLPIAPWASDPSGNNLNFAYGGAQIKQGDEVVSDLDAQTDAFRDAVDGDADPNALYTVTVGGNDIRSLVPTAGTVVGKAQAYSILDNRADILLHELGQLVTMDGVEHILITGIADVGLVARYDRDGNNILGPDIDLNGDGVLDPGEATRSAAATDYSRYLDHLVRTEVIPGLEALGATVTYIPLMDYVDEASGQAVTGALTANLNTIAVLNGVQPDESGETPGQQLSENLLLYDSLLFFDGLHPNAQANALLGAFMNAQLTGTAWVETMPYLSVDVDYRAVGSIGVAKEVDNIVIATAANTTYTFQMLGVSSLTPYVLGQLGIASLPTGPILGDPMLRLTSSAGTIVGSDDDRGAGFDSSLVYQVLTPGTYTLQLSAVGSLTGNYVWTVTASGGAEGNSSYTVSNAATLVIENAAWAGVDTVSASVSYALGAGSDIEVLQTTNAKGKGAINLTGNEFDQTIIGNNGANVLEGKGGIDELRGGGGNDRFVLGDSFGGSQADRILDYTRGDVVDVSQVLKVAAGTNVISGGYLRVTTTGKIQVDLDGGSNNWVTLSTINGSDAVSVRYLSGGSATTLSVARVAETYLNAANSLASTAALAGALAAAGLATPSAAEPTGVTVEASVATGVQESTLASGGRTLEQRDGEQALDVAAQGSTVSIEPVRAADLSGLIAARAEHPHAMDSAVQLSQLSGGTEMPAHGPAATTIAFAVDAVALPPVPAIAAAFDEARITAEVGRVLADALGGSDKVASLLDAFPSHADPALTLVQPGVANGGTGAVLETAGWTVLATTHAHFAFVGGDAPDVA